MNTDIEKLNKQAKTDHVQANLELLRNWFKESTHYLTDNYQLDFEIETIGEEPTARTHFYTRDNLYSISVHTDYLGCTVTNRRDDVGESWNRGRDLPDGCFNKETWNKIMASIVFHEIKGIAGAIK